MTLSERAAKTKPVEKATHWKAMMKMWAASGESQRSFCASQNLSYHQLNYWRQKLRPKKAVASALKARHVLDSQTASTGDTRLKLSNGIEIIVKARSR